MAMASDKSLFIHIPKTGGWFIRYAFRDSNIAVEEVGSEHAYFPYLMQNKNEQFFAERKIFAFIRHPISWYQSRWAFRLKTGWCHTHPLDYNCASNDFKTFVSKCLEYEPTGWVTREYGIRIDTTPKPIDFVGRTEFIREDLLTFASMSGEPISQQTVQNLPRVNNADLDKKPSSHWAVYDESLFNRVMEVESGIIKRFYRDYDIDIKQFC